MERSSGSYSRSFDATGIDVEGIEASYEGGVLDLKLPKQTVATPETKQIEIH